MKAGTRKWTYRISFIIVILLLYFLQWKGGFIDSFKPVISEINPSFSKGEFIFFRSLDILVNIIFVYVLQIVLPIFLFYKGFIQKAK